MTSTTPGTDRWSIRLPLLAILRGYQLHEAIAHAAVLGAAGCNGAGLGSAPYRARAGHRPPQQAAANAAQFNAAWQAL